jgi:hypothetical protein
MRPAAVAVKVKTLSTGLKLRMIGQVRLVTIVPVLVSVAAGVELKRVVPTGIFASILSSEVVGMMTVPVLRNCTR